MDSLFICSLVNNKKSEKHNGLFALWVFISVILPNESRVYFTLRIGNTKNDPANTNAMAEINNTL